jgi:ribosomal protein L10
MRTNKKKTIKNKTKKRKIQEYTEEDIKKCMEKKCSYKYLENKHKELTKIFEDALKRNQKKLKNKNITEEEKNEAIQLIKNAKKNIAMMNSKYMINKNMNSMRKMCKINNL